VMRSWPPRTSAFFSDNGIDYLSLPRVLGKEMSDVPSL